MHKPAPADHPIHEILRERWSPRAFDRRRPVPREVLLSLLEAARWAPSANNEQPWSFVVGTREDPATFQRILACLNPRNQRWAAHAPVLLLTVTHRVAEASGRPNRHAYHDLGLAVAQLTLQAVAQGLAVHQMAGFNPEVAREAFGIPDGWDPVTVVAVGYPGSPEELPEDLRERELAPRRRKPLAAFVFTGRWGQPAAFLPDAAGDP